MNLRISLSRLAPVCFLVTALNINAADNYIPIELSHGIRVELPRNWVAISDNQRILLDSWVQAKVEKRGIFDASSDLYFGANFYDDSNKVAALFNIRFYPEIDLTQADARAVTSADTQDLDALIRSSVTKGMQGTDYYVTKWFGTTRQKINRHIAFITEYERSGINNGGNFRVRLVRFFNGRRSFTITVSYLSRQEYLLRPICDRVIYSIQP